MNNGRILFMIIDDKVTFLQDSTMDHREWYLSLGLDPNNFNNVVRGFIDNGKAVFYKGENFNYDEIVIKAARKYGVDIRKALNQMNLEICCGVLIDGYNAKWEPIVKINEEELEQVVEVKQEDKEKQINSNFDNKQVIDFNNNYDDSKFISRAIKVTILTLVLSIIVKVILVCTSKISFGNFYELLLVLGQVGFLIAALIGYTRKNKNTKYLCIAASVMLVLMFDFLDVVMGVLYFVYSVDEDYYIKGYSLVKKLIKKIQKK